MTEGRSTQEFLSLTNFKDRFSAKIAALAATSALALTACGGNSETTEPPPNIGNEIEQPYEPGLGGELTEDNSPERPFTPEQVCRNNRVTHLAGIVLGEEVSCEIGAAGISTFYDIGHTSARIEYETHPDELYQWASNLEESRPPETAAKEFAYFEDGDKWYWCSYKPGILWSELYAGKTNQSIAVSITISGVEEGVPKPPNYLGCSSQGQSISPDARRLVDELIGK